MPKVSVLTVTKRPFSQWLSFNVSSLQGQTFQDFEWIIVWEGEEAPPSNLNQYPGLEGKVFVYNAPERVDLSNLNRSLNEGLRHCEGEFVVFYQDFIVLAPDCIEKLVGLADEKTFVTTASRNPDGQLDIRYSGSNKPRPCEPREWEANIAIAPLAAIKELGGFDESYDQGWSWDNVNLAERAALVGCNFIIDESNQPQLFPHEKESLIPVNRDYHNEVMKKLQSGELDPHLHYL